SHYPSTSTNGTEDSSHHVLSLEKLHSKSKPPSTIPARITGSARHTLVAELAESVLCQWPGGRRLRIPGVRPGQRGARERDLRGLGEPDLHRHRDDEPSGGIEHPALDLADRGAARR